jgi:flavin-dependent dehydrogenase
MDTQLRRTSKVDVLITGAGPVGSTAPTTPASEGWR